MVTVQFKFLNFVGLRGQDTTSKPNQISYKNASGHTVGHQK